MSDIEVVPPKKQSWIGAKIFLGSIVGLLLSAGLCGVGAGPMVEHGGDSLMAVGSIVLFVSVLGVLVGGFIFFIEIVTALTRGK